MNFFYYYNYYLYFMGLFIGDRAPPPKDSFYLLLNGRQRTRLSRTFPVIIYIILHCRFALAFRFLWIFDFILFCDLLTILVMDICMGLGCFYCFLQCLFPALDNSIRTRKCPNGV